jgi:hypothetical protein
LSPKLQDLGRNSILPDTLLRSQHFFRKHFCLVLPFLLTVIHPVGKKVCPTLFFSKKDYLK